MRPGSKNFNYTKLSNFCYNNKYGACRRRENKGKDAMNKRISACLLAVALVLLATLPAAAGAAAYDLDRCSAKHVVLMEAGTGNVLLQKNATDKAFPASTTKIMTCLLALEHGNLEEEITVGEEVWRGFGARSSLAGFKEGEKLTLRALIYGTMLVSGNDAAAAIAVHVSGSESGFADLMNAKAREIGMLNTNFVNPHGKHEEEHYTTAYDMALLARYALQSDQFREIVGARTYQVGPTNRNSSGYLFENTNKLIYTRPEKQSYEYRYATGIKTGDTNQALRCLAASATKDGTTLIAVLLGDQEQDTRFTIAANLFDWGFENCITVDAAALNLSTSLERTVCSASFNDPESGLLTFDIDLSGQTITATQDDIDAIRQNPSAIELVPTYDEAALTAPVAAGSVVGKAAYRYNGAVLFEVDLVAPRNVDGLTASVLTPAPSFGPDDPPEPQSSSLLFWVLLAVAIVGIVLLVKFLRDRNYRRHGIRRRRKSNRRARSR